MKLSQLFAILPLFALSTSAFAYDVTVKVDDAVGMGKSDPCAQLLQRSLDQLSRDPEFLSLAKIYGEQTFGNDLEVVSFVQDRIIATVVHSEIRVYGAEMKKNHDYEPLRRMRVTGVLHSLNLSDNYNSRDNLMKSGCFLDREEVLAKLREATGSPKPSRAAPEAEPETTQMGPEGSAIAL